MKKLIPLDLPVEVQTLAVAQLTRLELKPLPIMPLFTFINQIGMATSGVGLSPPCAPGINKEVGRPSLMK